ncbi:MAG TPA: GSCFA domain-containing protein [Polyangia bacterium]
MTERPYETYPVVDGPLHGIAPLQIHVPSRPVIADFSARFFSVGSCFADRIAQALGKLGFAAFADATVTNHFSTRSLAPLLGRWVEGRSYTADDLHWFPGRNACVSPFHKHLAASGPGAVDRILGEMNTRDVAARRALGEADVIFLTLGSATYLQMRKTGAVLAYSGGVAPEDRETLTMSVAEIVADLETIYQRLVRLCRRPFHLVLTVSPQRYAWPPSPRSATDAGSNADRRVTPGLDPVVHSNLDKAKLRAAIDEFIRAHLDAKVEYFPAFDIVMDELRLYETFRNNHRDHLHVGFPATSNYVINRFLLSHCTEPVIAALQDFRRGIAELERAMVSDHSPTAQTRAREFVQRMREHRDRVGCHGLYGRVRAALANKHASHPTEEGAEVAGETAGIAVIDGALARLDRNLGVWRDQGKRVAVYGAGRHTRMLLRRTALAQAPVVVIADDYPEAEAFDGIPLVPREELPRWAPDVVVVSSVNFQSRMLEHLQGADALIYPVYAADELHQAQLTMRTYEARGDEGAPTVVDRSSDGSPDAAGHHALLPP